MKTPKLIALATLLLLTACASMQQQPQTTIVQSNQEAVDPGIFMPRVLKKIVAVARFTNDTRLASSFLTEGPGSAEKLSRAATDILTAKLAQTGHFVVIERYDSLAISNEQRVANIAELKIPADYLIIGSIAEFGRNATGNVGLIDRTKKQTAYAKVALRIVDTKTGVVIHGEEGTGEAMTESETVLGMGSQAGYDDTLTDKAMDAAIGSVINGLISQLDQTPWKSHILSIDGEKVFIAGGAIQGIKPFDVFYVYTRGETVINPQTNVPIELPGKLAAKIMIKELIPGSELTELSVGAILEGSISSTDLGQYYVSDR